MCNKEWIRNVVINYVLSLIALNLIVWVFGWNHLMMSVLMTGCYLLFVGLEIISDLWR